MLMMDLDMMSGSSLNAQTRFSVPPLVRPTANAELTARPPLWQPHKALQQIKKQKL